MFRFVDRRGVSATPLFWFLTHLIEVVISAPQRAYTRIIWQFFPLGLSLLRFHCIDELWDAIGISEYRLHQLWNIDGIDRMEARTKLGEIVKEFEGRGVCINIIWVL